MANELRVKSNFGGGVVSDNPLVIGATALNSAALASFPAISATQHAIIALDPTGSAGAPELIMVTAHTAAATSATITRGVEGTSARQHLQGTTWRHVATYYDDLQIVANAAALPSTNIYQGQMAYQQDLDKYVGRSSAGVWQDLVSMGAWTSYTPTLVQSGAVTKTVTYARYVKIGRLVIASGLLTVTGTGTAANGVVVGLPVASQSVIGIDIGSGDVFDTSAGAVYKGIPVTKTVNDFWYRTTSSTSSSVLGIDTFTAGLAVGDQISFTVTYEAAA